MNLFLQWPCPLWKRPSPFPLQHAVVVGPLLLACPLPPLNFSLHLSQGPISYICVTRARTHMPAMLHRALLMSLPPTIIFSFISILAIFEICCAICSFDLALWTSYKYAPWRIFLLGQGKRPARQIPTSLLHLLWGKPRSQKDNIYSNSVI